MVSTFSSESNLLNDWPIGPKYRFIQDLGKGSYAQVCEAIEIKTGRTFAIKKFLKATTEQTRARNCLREIEIITKMAHQNIIKVKEVFIPECEDNNSVFMVMEYFPLDLRKVIKSPAILEPINVKRLLYQILLSAYYMHTAKIVHRDLKPANILLDKKNTIKICDFGLSRSIGKEAVSKEDEDEIPDEIEDGLEKNCITYIPGAFTAGINTHIKCSVVNTEKCHSFSCEKLKTKKITEFPSSNKLIGCRARKRKSTFALLQPLQSGLLIQAKTNLTSHVVTRWYRAPEVILMEKQYGTAVDIWGIGCIFAELLQMLPTFPGDFSKRKAIFPGQSCFPLSPCASDLNEVSVDSDQLQVICNVLGLPKPDDTDFITNLSTKKYIKVLTGPTSHILSKIYYYAPKLAIDLLQKMLEFNPNKRISAKDALCHPYFYDIRDEHKEVEGEIIDGVTEYASDYIQMLKTVIEKLIL